MRFLRTLKNIWFRFLVWKADAYSLAGVYRKHLGIKIGEGVRITGKNIRFGSEPYLIEIGDDVTITNGVIFETHDGGVGLFRKEFPGINVFGRIKIGSHVFIGNNCIIMPGVTIGDNVVIGAGSIVTKDIPSEVVAAGIPARVLKTIEEYKQRSLQRAVYIFEAESEKREREILDKLQNKTGDL
jgi:acetyltransferase-like isoleucine patch superfamily enzyme